MWLGSSLCLTLGLALTMSALAAGFAMAGGLEQLELGA